MQTSENSVIRKFAKTAFHTQFRRISFIQRSSAWYSGLYELGRRRGGLHVAQRLEGFLDAYRRPDGSRWTASSSTRRQVAS